MLAASFLKTITGGDTALEIGRNGRQNASWSLTNVVSLEPGAAAAAGWRAGRRHDECAENLHCFLLPAGVQLGLFVLKKSHAPEYLFLSPVPRHIRMAVRVLGKIQLHHMVETRQAMCGFVSGRDAL